MKVDKETLLFCLDYLKRVNRRDLIHLDLSDFFGKDHKFVREEVCELSNGEEESIMVSDNRLEAIDHWRYTGLNNVDFILAYCERR